MCRRRAAIASLIAACAAATIFWAGCATAPRYTRCTHTAPAAPKTRVYPDRGTGQGESGFTGTASYYGTAFHGKKTASGERFNMHALTAAHPTLPFGVRVRVTNLDNGKSVVVRINDRGPFKKGRIIDLSHGAAREIGMIGTGTARVRLEVLR